MLDFITNAFAALVLALSDPVAGPPEPIEATIELPAEHYDSLHHEFHQQVGGVFRSHDGPSALIALAYVTRTWERRLEEEVSSNHRN